MDTLRSIIRDPIFSSIIDCLGEGDVRFNKELLLIARHMGLAQGFGNFRTLTSYATSKLMNMPMFTTTHTREHASAIEKLLEEFSRKDATDRTVFEYVIKEDIPDWIGGFGNEIMGEYVIDFSFLGEPMAYSYDDSSSGQRHDPPSDDDEEIFPHDIDDM